MKNIIFVIVLFAAVSFGCKKTETVQPNPQKPVTAFEVIEFFQGAIGTLDGKPQTLRVIRQERDGFWHCFSASNEAKEMSQIISWTIDINTRQGVMLRYTFSCLWDFTIDPATGDIVGTPIGRPDLKRVPLYGNFWVREAVPGIFGRNRIILTTK
jgi:hypothetical protein